MIVETPKGSRVSTRISIAARMAGLRSFCTRTGKAKPRAGINELEAKSEIECGVWVLWCRICSGTHTASFFEFFMGLDTGIHRFPGLPENRRGFVNITDAVERLVEKSEGIKGLGNMIGPPLKGF